MIKQIAQIFDHYDPAHVGLIGQNLLEYQYSSEAEILYENFEDLNIYDDKTLRQYVQLILRDGMFEDSKFDISEEMIRDLHQLLFKY